MAIKWGNTWVTTVKWGSTVVFPTGGYDGSTFSPPLTGGIRYRNGGGMGIWTNVTSGAISFTWSHSHSNSTSLSQGNIGSINDAIDFSQYTKIKISGSSSTTAPDRIRIMNYAQIWEWETSSGGYYDHNSKQMLKGGFTFDTEYSFTSTLTGALGLHFEFSNSSGVFTANHTVTVTKIELYN